MEEQNSANAEESATPANEPAALSGEADGAESTKSNGRTLKLKASEEQSDSAQSTAMDVSRQPRNARCAGRRKAGVERRVAPRGEIVGAASQ